MYICCKSCKLIRYLANYQMIVLTLLAMQDRHWQLIRQSSLIKADLFYIICLQAPEQESPNRFRIRSQEDDTSDIEERGDLSELDMYNDEVSWSFTLPDLAQATSPTYRIFESIGQQQIRLCLATSLELQAVRSKPLRILSSTFQQSAMHDKTLCDEGQWWQWFIVKFARQQRY